jgi:hypothetical protein
MGVGVTNIQDKMLGCGRLVLVGAYLREKLPITKLFCRNAANNL